MPAKRSGDQAWGARLKEFDGFIVLTAAAVPALVLGTVLGLRAYVRLPAQGFRIILLVLLFVSGISLLI